MADQVEFVAQAFYAVEYSGEWHEAPEADKEQFRRLAREAIMTLTEEATTLAA